MRFLTELSKHPKKKFNRESIIGLGEASFKKNYYPELQGKIIELEKINARNKSIINTIPDTLLIGDREGTLRRLMTVGGAEAGREALFIDDKKSSEILIRSVREVLYGQPTMTKELSLTDEHGEQRIFEARINATDYEEALIMIRDITEQRQMEAELRDMAERDSLCGTLNRRMFERTMLAFDGKEDVAFGIVIMDIDGLKFINDTLGHESGDEAIRTVAHIIEKNFEPVGATYRLSGDEFGVLGAKVSVEASETAMIGVNADIDAYNDHSDRLKLSVSYGAAENNGGKLDVRHLFRMADNNMYQNKMFKSSSVRSSLVKTLMKALEARDFITEGHADRMEQLATDMGIAVGLSRNQLDKMKLLAKFHDIGKVGIPDKILKKPAKLTDEEYEVMKTHTQIGKRIANESVDLVDIANLIYYHHERWDGAGYPEQIAGEEIPIECRILAIVDTFDAMTNDRPYRKGLPVSVAVEEIRTNAGSQFDPALVDVFIGNLGSE